MNDISDVVIIPISPQHELVIASDNSGAIGMKSLDEVRVTNEVTSYYACRVAYMDFIRVGGIPKAIVIQNFTGDCAWQEYEVGIKRFLEETNSPELPITGSTESNFVTVQSGIGLTIIGIRDKHRGKRQKLNGTELFAVIGKPLVGKQALDQREHIAPISLYEQFAQMDEVIDLLPVGSKGIAAEWRKLTKKDNKLACELDIEQSGGPATCFIIAYNEENGEKLKQIAEGYFYHLYVCN